MTNYEIDIAIAEACGWNVHLSNMQSGLDVVRDGVRKPLPNYCNDLNAMHKAEKVLTEINWFTYISELAQIVRLPKQAEVQIKQSIHATAKERAEAFLKALGKWEEVVE